MKIIVRITLIVLLLLASAVFVYRVVLPWASEDMHPIKSKLYVNGNLVEDNNVTIYYHGSIPYAELPLLSTVESFGYRISVESDDLVYLERGNEKYCLYYNQPGRRLCTDDGELVCGVPGYPITDLRLKGRQGEIMSDSEALIQMLNNMGISPVEITIDPQNKTVLLEGPQFSVPD